MINKYQNHIFQLDEHTWRIEEGEGPGRVYAFVVEGEREAVLIDACFGRLPLREIAEELTGKKVTLLLTHAHFDHVGGCRFFEEAYLHPADFDLYQDSFPPDGEERPGSLMRIETAPDDVGGAKTKLLPLCEGQVFDLGARTLEVIETPGHTGGCVCFLDRERRVLFTGDTCCKADVLLGFPQSLTVEAFHASISKLLSLRDKYDITYPAHHGFPVEIEVLEQFQEAAKQIMDGRLIGEPRESFGRITYRAPFKDIAIAYKEGGVRGGI